MISEKAPGKLFIAGEYAVIENGMPSIIVAINKFVTISINKSIKFGSISSEQYQDTIIWWRKNQKIIFQNNKFNHKHFQYVISAINITEKYIKELGINLKTFNLNISSELNSSNGKKYGLGSSAAVTVATIKALCKFYKANINNEILFKLSAISHLNVQKNGSLGDVAASVYGGWIEYHTFNKKWLINLQSKLNIQKLISIKWPYLYVKRLVPPKNLKLIIGWTGNPSSTQNFIKKINIFKIKHTNKYNYFLNSNKSCLYRMTRGFNIKNLNIIKKEIIYDNYLLNKLSKWSSIPIETFKLKILCASAKIINGAGKVSGSGGGDCGIVITNKSQNINPMLKIWAKNNIELLPLKVFTWRNYVQKT